MWIDNEIYLNDLNSITANTKINFEKLRNKNILITGATGLIGSLMINTLLYLNKTKNINCNIFAFVRNIEKAQKIFHKQINENYKINFIVGDITSKIDIEQNIDYIIHAASETSSKYFSENPVETIDSILIGTKNILNFAKEKSIQKIIYLSTMEVYGRPETDEKINENYPAHLNTMEVRNSYPISKRMCENLCVSYNKEFNINFNILRLTQTFGPGVQYNDGRVFAEFARSVIENKDIILHTKGETKRNYLYTMDAIQAILLTLTSDISNEVYNVANENTYCSIYEMAVLMKELNKNINVKIEEEDISKFGYSKTLHINLDTSKIKKIGFTPTKNLKEMFKNMIDTMEK